MYRILTPEQQEKAEYIACSPYSQLANLTSREVRDLCTAWCYYSGKIEGNTYTYFETAVLIEDGITSKKRYEDAKMLKNLYNAFNGEVYYIKEQGLVETIDENLILRLHQAVIADLVSMHDAGQWRQRPVRITGTNYIPPKSTEEIRSRIATILWKANEFDNPIEKSIYLHCNIARLQPFIDGNKRVSRLVESVALMNGSLVPIFSTLDEDFERYRSSLIKFYESENLSEYADYSLDSQISRINELALPAEQYPTPTSPRR